MTALAAELRATIADSGPMPLGRFMSLCLARYYATRDPFGAAGDFVTAPEVSQMFGELIGLWCADAWGRLGAPAALALVELGPGRGTLMADALRAARILPAFRAALTVHLVETSPALRARQKTALADAGVPLVWHERFEDVPAGPLLVVANEFFDALPITQLVRTATGWHERLVGLDAAGRLAFGLMGAPVAGVDRDAPEGAVLELAPQRAALAAAIAGRVVRDGGAALVIDYGHAASGLGDTLQAVKAHRFADPLAEPGDADLTSHVDFAALAAAARAAGAAVHGPIDQGTFLTTLGLDARAAQLKTRATPAQAAAVDAARARLAGADGMGTLFKAMAIADPRIGTPAGFAPA